MIWGLEKNRATGRSISPLIIATPPVLAPNLYWAARVPEPWHIGKPPNVPIEGSLILDFWLICLV